MMFALQFHWLKYVLVVECTIETMQINEDGNVTAAETFGGNLKQTVIPYLNNFFCVFSVSYTDFCCSQL